MSHPEQHRALVLGLVLFGLGCRGPSGAVELLPIDGPGVRALAEGGEARATVVNLWATWCAPCKEEFPELIRVGRSYAERDVRLHFVSLDFPSEREAAMAFLTAQRAPSPSYLRTGKDDAFINAVNPRWSGSLPATIVFDGEGRIRYFYEGKITEDRLSEALDQVLDPPKP